MEPAPGSQNARILVTVEEAHFDGPLRTHRRARLLVGHVARRSCPKGPSWKGFPGAAFVDTPAKGVLDCRRLGFLESAWRNPVGS